MKESDWFGLYRSGWQGEIVPEAFSHPAKFSRGLIRKIYEYAIEQGYLKEGQTVFDPFAGVALGGLDAMFHGLHFIGCELEDKFVQLGQQNIDLWNRRYGNGKLPRWGTAVIVQGDSRDLARVLAGARAKGIIASPPYASAVNPHGEGPGMAGNEAQRKRIEAGSVTERAAQSRLVGYGTDARNLGNMPTGDVDAVIASPPYTNYRLPAQDGPEAAARRIQIARDRGVTPDKVPASDYRGDGGYYGTDPAQLGNMPTGEPPQVDAVIASPPYAKSATNGARENRATNLEVAGIDSKAWLGKRRCTQGRSEGYGISDGQLAALPEGEPPKVDGIVSSPPFLDPRGVTGRSHDGLIEGGYNGGKTALNKQMTTESNGQLAAMQEGEPPAAIVSSPPYSVGTIGAQGYDWFERGEGGCQVPHPRHHRANYGSSPGQLDGKSQDTFWSAAKTILLQCHAVLAPGGVAIWVLKDFIRAKRRIDFTGQWQALCESCGFETVEVIRAWLTEERGTQYDLKGEAHTKVVERKSFFRRLAEKKGSPRIDYEVVLVMKKS